MLSYTLCHVIVYVYILVQTFPTVGDIFLSEYNLIINEFKIIKNSVKFAADYFDAFLNVNL